MAAAVCSPAVRTTTTASAGSGRHTPNPVHEIGVVISTPTDASECLQQTNHRNHGLSAPSNQQIQHSTNMDVLNMLSACTTTLNSFINDIT